MIDIPFIPGILILLMISIVIIRVYMEIANNIGEWTRRFFLFLWQIIKKSI